MKAKDIMTSEVITVKKDTPIEDIAKILIEKRISGVVVVDDENKVVGVVSETDIVKKEKNIKVPSFITILQGVVFLDSIKEMEEDIKRVAAYKAEDIMSSDVLTVNEKDDLEYVANLMIEKSINRVPVVDDTKTLKGIICRYDIIKSMFSR
ncbi:CBS domain-containing protein [Alkalithermobacter thermoalcaliphilus JW-YL-7 = DSM 7308]|uniref:CBS domain containing membrane protein n=1 Tax=Alkalithermobacter thermoalcaliphilus JW-YL-7 = DSM 7308 TaxID=1121328 RepID=A0A150FSB7_CLOPD|nr:CBS domain containing membrane protein [[Clostridium] paradoxum JW-YL-7 = DSM 7308]SHK72227.1 CBS domain-containing protein [[Clostridium] paradoxum JW-YL-7 = DSM 7308]